MDMLYHRYACPMDLIKMYIRRGRFGEWVTSFLDAERQRMQDEAEKEEEHKLWTMYIHSMSDKSFIEWKKQIFKSVNNNKKTNRDEDLNENSIKSILDDLFPST